MNISFKIIALLFSLVTLLIILWFVRKGRISVKYSFIWLLSSGGALILVMVPNLLEALTKLLGFEVPSNMVFSIILVILMFVCISLTIIISGLNEKVRLLIQEVSIIKGELNDKKKSK